MRKNQNQTIVEIGQLLNDFIVFKNQSNMLGAWMTIKLAFHHPENQYQQKGHFVERRSQHYSPRSGISRNIDRTAFNYNSQSRLTQYASPQKNRMNPGHFEDFVADRIHNIEDTMTRINTKKYLLSKYGQEQIEEMRNGLNENQYDVRQKNSAYITPYQIKHKQNAHLYYSPRFTKTKQRPNLTTDAKSQTSNSKMLNISSAKINSNISTKNWKPRFFKIYSPFNQIIERRQLMEAVQSKQNPENNNGQYFVPGLRTMVYADKLIQDQQRHHRVCDIFEKWHQQMKSRVMHQKPTSPVYMFQKQPSTLKIDSRIQA